VGGSGGRAEDGGFGWYKVTDIVAAVGFVGGTATYSDLSRGKTCS
jgi:hypothetical protein